jgi:hypothetical protein
VYTCLCLRCLVCWFACLFTYTLPSLNGLMRKRACARFASGQPRTRKRHDTWARRHSKSCMSLRSLRDTECTDALSRARRRINVNALPKSETGRDLGARTRGLTATQAAHVVSKTDPATTSSQGSTRSRTMRGKVGILRGGRDPWSEFKIRFAAGTFAAQTTSSSRTHAHTRAHSARPAPPRPFL